MRACERCGKEFSSRHPEQRFCGRSCHMYARHHPPVDLVCRGCGGTFSVEWSRADQRIYCSRACMGVSFPEPHGGTCNDEACPLHGFCHCDKQCGAATTVAEKARSSSRVNRGKPFMYKHGHNPRTKANLSFSAKNNVPVERIQPLFDYLTARYPRLTAYRLVYSERAGYKLNAQQGVKPATARKLVEVVLAHKTAADFWAEEKSPRRLPSQQERADSHREMRAQEKRGERARAG